MRKAPEVSSWLCSAPMAASASPLPISPHPFLQGQPPSSPFLTWQPPTAPDHVPSWGHLPLRSFYGSLTPMESAQPSFLCAVLQAPSWPGYPLSSCVPSAAHPGHLCKRCTHGSSCCLLQLCPARVCSCLLLSLWPKRRPPLAFKASKGPVLGAEEFQEGLEEDLAAEEPLSISLLP